MTRLASWRGGWRLALRMARRDLRRHRGRSLLVAVMVAVPLAVIAFLATTAQTALSSNEATAARLMGPAAAIVTEPVSSQLLQTGSHEYFAPVRTPDGERGGGDLVVALPIPGYDSDRTPAENSAAIAALTGGTATPVAEPRVRVRVGDRAVSMQTLAVDGSLDLGDKARLLTGRWPAGPDEVLVSAPGQRKGLPGSGTVELVTAEGPRTLTVVGTAAGATSWGMVPHLVSSEPLPGPGGDAPPPGRWLITGTQMPYALVTELGRYGLHVQSAELMARPVPAEQLPEELRAMSFSESPLLFFWVTGAVLLALVIALLVAPAFAVSAARQRRTLALAASNGATTVQLRRTVLAQALLLGVLSALLAVGAGVAGATGLAWWRSRTATDIQQSLVDVPWSALGALTLCAVTAALVAALLPARRLGRIDIMGVLKGQSVSPPPSRLLPVVGGVVMVVSAAGLLLGARRPSDGEYVVAVAAIGLVVGALSLVPMILVGIGRLAATLPVPLRMAARDAARQRARSVPSVAAVLGGVAALTIALVAATSDGREAEATYLPQTVPGQGILRVWEAAELESAAAAVRTTLPGAVLTPMSTVDDGFWQPGQGGIAFVTLVEPACSFAQATDVEGGCRTIGGPFGWSGSIVALPAEALVQRLALSAGQAEQLRAGAAVVPAGGVLTGSTALAHAGTFAAEEMSGMPTDITATGTTEVPLIVLPEDADTRALMLGDQAAAFVAVETAQEQGWPLASTAYLFDSGEGLGEVEAERVRERLENAEVYVERGYVDDVRRFLLGLVAAVSLILLVVTLTSTALSMAEQRRDDATLAAVGATRGTRRGMAAAQAFVAAGTGAVLGLLVGLVPGITFAYPLTTSMGSDGEQVGPFVTVPYALLAVIVVGVPLLGAALSALAVRRAPVVTRRVG